jgi:hypothetical protein
MHRLAVLLPIAIVTAAGVVAAPAPAPRPLSPVQLPLPYTFHGHTGEVLSVAFHPRAGYWPPRAGTAMSSCGTS